MAITKTITANGSKGHHRFSLKVNEDTQVVIVHLQVFHLL